MDNELKQLGRQILEQSPAGETEVKIFRREEGLTRFAKNYITQNVHKDVVSFEIRVQNGKQASNIMVESRDPDTLLQSAEKAHELSLMEHNRDSEALSFLGGSEGKTSQNGEAFSGARSQDDLADVIEKIVEPVEKRGNESYGTSSSVCNKKIIMNTRGLECEGMMGENHSKVTVWAGDGTGWGEEGLALDRTLDPERFVDRAVEKAERSRDPVEIEPGPIDVILEPAAAGILLRYLGFGAFGGREFVENRSYLSTRLGENIFGEKITLVDDASDDRIPSFPFDDEGMVRKTVPLIENGVARNVVHSRRTAKKAGANPTGHSINGHGGTAAYPSNLVLKAGKSSREEMIREAERAVLVTQFHYCNFQDRSKLILTGMTRNGTFLVENGKVTKPIKNMRFTQSLPEALSRTLRVGDEPVYTVSGGNVVAPHLMLKDFHFTGKTRF